MRIIEHGKKTFIVQCPRCGCKFEYKIEELIGGQVKCPDCSDWVTHPNQIKNENITVTPEILGGKVGITLLEDIASGSTEGTIFNTSYTTLDTTYKAEDLENPSEH